MRIPIDANRETLRRHRPSVPVSRSSRVRHEVTCGFAVPQDVFCIGKGSISNPLNSTYGESSEKNGKRWELIWKTINVTTSITEDVPVKCKPWWFYILLVIFPVILRRETRQGPVVGQYNVDLSSFESLALPELSIKVGQTRSARNNYIIGQYFVNVCKCIHT